MSFFGKMSGEEIELYIVTDKRFLASAEITRKYYNDASEKLK